MSATAFRGYQASPGILYRDSDGNYGLTNERDGADFNPFELYGYYGNDESLNQYYFKWHDLRDELGADGSNNIVFDSPNLPDGWIFPYNQLWDKIFNGKPMSAITVGSTVLSPTDNDCPKPYAHITVNKGEDQYFGLLLLRDGATVDVDLAKIGLGSTYSDNVLDYDTQFVKFLDAGCAFFCCSGAYKDTNDSYRGWISLGPHDEYEGYYWSSTYSPDTDAGYFQQTNKSMNGSTKWTIGSYLSFPVRLFQPAFD